MQQVDDPMLPTRLAIEALRIQMRNNLQFLRDAGDLPRETEVACGGLDLKMKAEIERLRPKRTGVQELLFGKYLPAVKQMKAPLHWLLRCLTKVRQVVFR
jgi:hypothetical protein